MDQKHGGIMNVGIYNKKNSLLIVFITYTAAFFLAAVVFILFRRMGIIAATLIADIAATLLVWGTGLIFRNASLYDPYWSIVPVFVIPFWVILKGNGAGVLDILLILAITLWGFRLTLNWIIGWRGLRHQDWRYIMLKKKNPDIWLITNLGGINMMPTLIVFLGMIPAYFMINSAQKLNVISMIGFVLCLAATTLQFFADTQMSRFRKNDENCDKCINTGLWKYSRHPNYLGEITLWWGIWLMQMGVAPRYWVTVAGPVAMTLLFVFISVPMMEKYILNKRPSYSEYKKEVPMLIPRLRK